MTKRVALSHYYSWALFDKISNNYLARGSINELEFTFAAVLTKLLNLYLPLAFNWAFFGIKEQLSLTLKIASLMAISPCEPPTTPSVITLERKWHKQWMNKTRKLFFLTKRLNERLILARFAITKNLVSVCNHATKRPCWSSRRYICLKDFFYRLPYDSHLVVGSDDSTACGFHQAIALIYYQLVNRRYGQMKICSTRSKRRDQ